MSRVMRKLRPRQCSKRCRSISDSNQRFILLSLVAVASCRWFFVTLAPLPFCNFLWLQLRKHLCLDASWQSAAIVQTGKICWYLLAIQNLIFRVVKWRHVRKSPMIFRLCDESGWYARQCPCSCSIGLLDSDGSTCPLQVLVHWMWCETSKTCKQLRLVCYTKEKHVEQTLRMMAETFSHCWF